MEGVLSADDDSSSLCMRSSGSGSGSGSNSGENNHHYPTHLPPSELGTKE